MKLFAEELLLNGKGAASCAFLGNDFVISAYGDIYLCPMLPDYTIGNILDFNRNDRDSINNHDLQGKTAKLKELSDCRRLPVCSECCVEKLSLLIFDVISAASRFIGDSAVIITAHK